MPDVGPEHQDGEGRPIRTRNRKYRYFFYVKHHDGSENWAQWLPEISHEEEFRIFDEADYYDLCDDSRRALYGLRRSQDGNILKLGAWDELVAEFPWASSENAWHGYPLWPVLRLEDKGVKIKKRCPAKEVFLKMERAELIDGRERRRLEKGKHL
jgi:hypothetical protein